MPALTAMLSRMQSARRLLGCRSNVVETLELGTSCCPLCVCMTVIRNLNASACLNASAVHFLRGSSGVGGMATATAAASVQRVGEVHVHPVPSTTQNELDQPVLSQSDPQGCKARQPVRATVAIVQAVHTVGSSQQSPSACRDRLFGRSTALRKAPAL